jgi:hypothetical protein
MASLHLGKKLSLPSVPKNTWQSASLASVKLNTRQNFEFFFFFFVSITYSSKFISITSKIPCQITKILHEAIYVVYCVYIKFCSQVTIQPSFWLQSYQIFLNAMIFFLDASCCKHHIWQKCVNTFQFLTPASMHDTITPWKILWFLDFIFFGISKPFGQFP